MAIEAGDVIWNITGQTKDLNQALKDSERMARESFGRITQIAGAAFTAIGASITGFGIMSLKEFAESERASVKLDQVLRSTAGAAGMTRQACDELAESLKKATTYDDDEIRSAEALMLTFTAIGKDVFPQATESVLDLATMMNGDLQGAVIQLGKALNDPIQGVGALQRVGVSFTETQKEEIKVLMESNRMFDAQKLILAELNKEFGGQARADRESFAGQMKILKNEFGDLEKAVGKTLVPDLERFNKSLKDSIPGLTAFAEAHPGVIKTVGGFGLLADVLGPLLIALPGLKIAIDGAFWAMAGLGGAMVALPVAAIAADIGILIYDVYELATALPQINHAMDMWRGSIREGQKDLVILEDEMRQKGITFDADKVKTLSNADALAYLTKCIEEQKPEYEQLANTAADATNAITGATQAGTNAQAQAYIDLTGTVAAAQDAMLQNIVGTASEAAQSVVGTVGAATQQVQGMQGFLMGIGDLVAKANGLGPGGMPGGMPGGYEPFGNAITGNGGFAYQNLYASDFGVPEGLNFWGADMFGDGGFDMGGGFDMSMFPGVPSLREMLAAQAERRNGGRSQQPTPQPLQTPTPLPTPRPLPSVPAPAAASYAPAGPTTINVTVTMPVQNIDLDVKSDLEEVSRELGKRIRGELRRRGQ